LLRATERITNSPVRRRRPPEQGSWSLDLSTRSRLSRHLNAHGLADRRGRCPLHHCHHMGCVRGNRFAATRDAATTAHAHVLSRRMASMVGRRALYAPRGAPRNVPELLWTAVIAGSHRRVGGEPRRGVRSAADRRRRRPQRPRRWFLRGPPLPERRNILHPR